ncbi:VOC family protein [Aestuariivita sp.]|jgi:predicted enzyme related to lactoylglutathione lyase|uniref:VOC family protein n=1 Tax=Aestuariivita sp. TaxID=1872407 RepID=UPI002173AE28|nr:VOC family protein [Aestuariivita sp.]MCE8005922.1 VOC family protein [Aestuariivita sp.]
MNDSKTGQIVWHDLFTQDRPRAMAFYKGVAAWSYQIEHATEFSWGGGEQDFVLALLKGEAGTGFAPAPSELGSGWVAYVEVEDVDATVVLAQTLGATVVRPPFEVPGVGRNALLRDPLGALLGISLSRHAFPVPRQQFGPEHYLTDAAFPEAFYTGLFHWTGGSPLGEAVNDRLIDGPSGRGVARHVVETPPDDVGAIWVPSLWVADPLKSAAAAQALGGEVITDRPARQAGAGDLLLRDPAGSLCFLCKV